MSVWILLQILFNILILAGVSVCLIKTFREKEDDPRLTQGLRLLQSKISILEDLSDHTENQVKQLMTLLDKKLHEVRSTMKHINTSMEEVDRSIQKSQKMATEIQKEMTTDRIHEKKLDNKYIQAAQLAHQGYQVEDIVQSLGLPKAEVELIVKVNQKKCVYETSQKNLEERIFSKSLQLPAIENSSVEQTNMNFQKAVQEHNEFQTIKLG